MTMVLVGCICVSADAQAGSAKTAAQAGSAKAIAQAGAAKAGAAEVIARSDFLRRQKRAQEALVLLDSAIKSMAKNSDLYSARSACYLDLRNLEKAEADIDLAVKNAAKSQVEAYARLYSSLCEHYAKKLQPEKMRAALDKYVNASHSIDAYCARAQFLRTRGDITGALKDLDAAIALAPMETKTLEQKARTASKGRRPKEAIDAYTKLIKIYSTRPNQPGYAWSGRGYCYNKLGEHEKAVADFDIAIKRGFDRKTVLTRAKSLEALGKYSEALKDADTILKKEPNNLTAQDVRIAALEHLGKNDQALVEVNSLIQRYPSSAIWYRRRAAIYKAMGKEADAQQDLLKLQKMQSLLD